MKSSTCCVKFLAQVTILLIEHDIDVVLKLSDRVTVMHQGRFWPKGRPTEVERNARVQDAYFGSAICSGGGDHRVILEVEGHSLLLWAQPRAAWRKSRFDAGEIVSLLGRNGAGKTTTIQAIMGLVKARSGIIRIEKSAITGLPPHEICRRGIGWVPQGRRTFLAI